MSDYVNNTYDLIVIGAGPAGMSAAVTANSYGLKTLLLDEQAALGGQIYRAITATDKTRQAILGPDYVYGASLANKVIASDVEYWPNTAVWQVTPEKTVHVLKDGKNITLQAGSILIATGAMERPFPVEGWTLPGVMTAGAGQILLKSAGVVPSEPVVIAGCGPLLYLIAAQYIRAGVKIKAILDTSKNVNVGTVIRHVGRILSGWKYVNKGLHLLKAIKQANIPFYKNVTHIRLQGHDAVEQVSFESQGISHTLDTSLVLLHQGVIPNTQITWSIRAKHTWNKQQLCWHPDVDQWGQLSVPNIYVAGDGAAIGGALVAEIQGELTALGIVLSQDKIDQSSVQSRIDALITEKNKHLAIRPFLDEQYQPLEENRIPENQVIVCRCEEVTAGQIRDNVAIGCTGPNQTKSFSRCGMGPCQGRQCGLTVTEIIAKETGLPHQDVGYYRIRPPLKSITLGQLAEGE